MSVAYRCGLCDDPPSWRLTRYGDAVVTWACTDHLHLVADDLLVRHHTDVKLSRVRVA